MQPSNVKTGHFLQPSALANFVKLLYVWCILSPKIFFSFIICVILGSTIFNCGSTLSASQVICTFW